MPWKLGTFLLRGFRSLGCGLELGDVDVAEGYGRRCGIGERDSDAGDAVMDEKARLDRDAVLDAGEVKKVDGDSGMRVRVRMWMVYRMWRRWKGSIEMIRKAQGRRTKDNLPLTVDADGDGCRG